VYQYAPELEKRCRPHLKTTTGSWRVDETYVKGVWMYLYRAVDSQGNTVEFHLSPKRDAQAAKRFFSKAHTVTSRVITVDKNAAYPKALHELQAAGAVPIACELRQSKYFNNLIEQDRRFIKRPFSETLYLIDTNMNHYEVITIFCYSSMWWVWTNTQTNWGIML